MGQYTSNEEHNMVKDSMTRVIPNLKKACGVIGDTLILLIQWGGCIIFTIFIALSNIFVNLSRKFNNQAFLYWDLYMDRCDRKRIIKERINKTSDDSTDYLVRYYIFLKGSGNSSRSIPFNVFIHKFIKSDEPVMHDHPWGYTTIILSGGYWEHIPIDVDGKIVDTKFWRGPGYWNSYSSSHKHWIELPANAVGSDATSPCWTLFIPRVKKHNGKWGFYPNLTNEKQSNEWIESDQYLVQSKKDN